MNNLSILLGFIGLLLISCSAGKELQRAQSENGILKNQVDSLYSHIALQQSNLSAFEDTKIQLRKTEQTLIQFYQKYEGLDPAQAKQNTTPSTSNALMNDKDLALRNQSLQNQISVLNARLDSFSKNPVPSKSRTAKTEQTKLSLKQQQQIINLQKENTELKKNIQELQAKNDQLDREQKQLLEEFKKTIQTLDLVNNQLTEKNALIKTMQENVSLIPKRDETELNEAKVENEQLKTQNNLLIQKLEYLNRLLADKNAELSENIASKDLENQIKSYEAELDDRAQVIRSLNGFIDAKNAELQSLNDSLEINRGRTQDYQQRMAALEKQNSLLEAHRINEASKLKSDADIQHQMEQLNKDHKLKQEMIRSLTTEVEKANENSLNLKRELELKINELNAARGQLENSKMTAAEKTQIKEIQDSLILIQKQKSDLMNELNSIQNTSESLMEIKNTTVQKNAFLQKQLESAAFEIGQLQSQLKNSLQANKPAQKSTPPNHPNLTKLHNKCKEILNPYSNQKSAAIIRQGSLFIYLPHHILFTQDSYVMTPEGSDLLNKLAVVLKNESGMELEISGYTKKSDPTGLSVDFMIRNASTVFKLFSALGLQANKLKLGAKYIGDDIISTIAPKGIELKSHAF
ncbi:MAG: hypothetical protein IPM92_11955 [Saprospiraceae bacterium]|nr:hypothetical protein [Saprospiraceae bacterium]